MEEKGSGERRGGKNTYFSQFNDIWKVTIKINFEGKITKMDINCFCVSFAL